MSYRALPLAKLLRGLPLKADEVIEVVATDGFVTLLPPDLVFGIDDTASLPYLAIEPVDEPWPVVPGKTVSAVPFYVVWLNPEAVRRTQRAVALRSRQRPQRRAAGAPLASSGYRRSAPGGPYRPITIHRAVVGHTLNGAREC